MFDSCRAAVGSKRRVCVALVFISLGFFCGCGSGQPRTYPVQGSVRFEDGREVRVGVIEFRSKESGHVARGTIDQGRFELGTFRSNDGAVAGEHQVIVVQHFDPLRKPHHEDPDHQRFLVQRRYADYGSSGLTAVVRPERNNRVELVVGRAAR